LGNQRAGIDVASSDNAVGPGTDDLVRLQRQQLLISGLGLKHGGVRVVCYLLRNNLLGDQRLIASVGNPLQPEVGLCISDLLVELGRFEDRQHLALVHTIAFVDVDRFQVAGGFRIDWRLYVAVDAGRKRDAPAVVRVLYLHYQHPRAEGVGLL